LDADGRDEVFEKSDAFSCLPFLGPLVEVIVSETHPSLHDPSDAAKTPQEIKIPDRLLQARYLD
jgi:hypothetical protein